MTPGLIDENTNTTNQTFDQTETGQNTDSTDYHSGLNSEQFDPTMDVTYNYDENNFGDYYNHSDPNINELPLDQYDFELQYFNEFDQQEGHDHYPHSPHQFFRNEQTELEYDIYHK